MRIGVECQPQGILAWMPKTLAILGAGRVGRALGRLLHERGWHILTVAAYSEATARKAAKFIHAGRPLAGISHHALAAKTILVCVPDDKIPEAAASLARLAGQQLRRKIVLPTTRARHAAAIQPVRPHRALAASMRSLHTFNS